MALTKVTYPDSEKILLGTGDDLEIYFDNTHSRIVHTPATGDLVIQSDDIYLTNGAGSEYYFRGTKDGAVELYHDNTKRFETTSSGVTITGNYASTGYIDIDSDSSKFRCGDGQDLEIYHDGSNSYIHNGTGILRVRGSEIRLCNTDNETYFMGAANGAAKLYYDDSVKFETKSYGADVTGGLIASSYAKVPDDGKFYAGNDEDFRIYHDGTHTYITNTTGDLKITDSSAMIISTNSLRLKNGDASETYIAADTNADVKLYYDNAEKLSTASWGVEVTGTLRADVLNLLDSEKIKLGAASDCEIFHDGTNTMIDNNTGDLKISSSGALRLRGDQVSLQDEDQTEAFIHCVKNDSVDLYYDNVKKFETTSTGVKVTGTINETGQEHDIWRITNTLGSSDSTITSNLERDDTQSFSVPGSGMSHSSGIFSFPSTGYWEVTFSAVAYDHDPIKYAQIGIWQTNDDSNWVEVSKAMGSMHEDSGNDNVYATPTCKQIIDVTNTSNVKVKFRVTSHATVNWYGNSTVNMTHFIFKRLGDT